MLATWALALLLTQNFTPEDLAEGKNIFQSNCGGCHGPDGTGGRGPNLAIPKLKRGSDAAAIGAVIAYGIAGTEMPSGWYLGERKVTLLTVYVMTLGSTARATVSGDPLSGKMLFSEKCAGCHIVNGTGGNIGPELSDVGARRNAVYLRELLLHPESKLPPGFVMLKAVTRNDATVRGIRVNEDTFTVQIRDMSGRFHSLAKQDLKELTTESGRTPMPSYRGLAAIDLDNLIAYLTSLRGER